jgi:hypothetical protein
MIMSTLRGGTMFDASLEKVSQVNVHAVRLQMFLAET